MAAYAGEINRLKALVAKLQCVQCVQFGKSSEKLRENTARQVHEAEGRIGTLQEEMPEVLGDQYDPGLPQPLHQSSARRPLPVSLPREIRTLQPAETSCPACGDELSALGYDVPEQLELISSGFKVIEAQRPKLACSRCDCIVQAPLPPKPIERVTPVRLCWRAYYRQSEIYRRQGVGPCHAGALIRCCQRTAGATA